MLIWYKQEYRKSESERLGPRGYSEVSRASTGVPCCRGEDDEPPTDSPQASLLNKNGGRPLP